MMVASEIISEGNRPRDGLIFEVVEQFEGELDAMRERAVADLQSFLEGALNTARIEPRHAHPRLFRGNQ